MPTWELIAELLDRHSSALHGYLRRKHGVGHEDDRNGILSATSLRVARAYKPKPRDTFRKFKGYFLTSIDSEKADRWRKYGSRFFRSDEKTLVALSARLETHASPEDEMIAREERALWKERLDRLRVAIRSLPWKQRTGLLLSLEKPKPSTAEIALALRTSCDAVRQLISRGRRRLRELLLGDSH